MILGSPRSDALNEEVNISFYNDVIEFYKFYVTVIVMQDKNHTVEKYQDKMEDFTHKVKSGAEVLGAKALNQAEDLGHKAIAGSENIGSKAVQGIHNLKQGAERLTDKTIEGVHNLQEKMKHK